MKIASYLRARKITVVYALLAAWCVLGVCGCKTHKRDDSQGMAEISLQGGKVQSRITDLQQRIVTEAMQWMGTPYTYARAEKGVATDCSGMVLSVYRDVAGIELPRNSAKQAEFSLEIGGDEVTVGDLVFFATGRDPDRVSHVGIMLDGDRFIHASSSRGVVISSVKAPYYLRTFKKFGRILDLKRH